MSRWQWLRRRASRIGVRLLLAFGLVAILPTAALLGLGFLEARLSEAEGQALGKEAEVLAAALSAKSNLHSGEVELVFRELRVGAVTRARLVDAEGWLLADSELVEPARSALPPSSDEGEAPTPWNERAADLVLDWVDRAKPWSGGVPGGSEIEPDPYVAERPFLSAEILGALAGRIGTARRRPADGAAPILYATAPVYEGEEVVGAVLLSRAAGAAAELRRTLARMLVQAAALALVAALVATAFAVATIAHPLRRLREEVATLLDRRGRIRGRLSGARRHDEIGDLARALEDLSERLEERVGFIEGFAADVSHEFKNPLASIRVATEILADAHEPGERRRFLAFVERDVARMEHLLNALREVTQIDAQRDPGDEAPVDLGELLSQLAEGFRMRAGSRVKIEHATADGPLLVYGGQERLAQVFENLLDNALSFSPEGGRVDLSVTRSDGEVVVSVQDEGPGIPEHHRERIFRRFFSYRPADDEAEMPHTGLGLAIVKAIVEGYGGSVTAGSAPSGGARITVRLPALDAAAKTGRRRGA